MTLYPARKTLSPCVCDNCLCRRGPRCRCKAYNDLLDLVCWDFGRTLRRFLFRR